MQAVEVYKYKKQIYVILHCCDGGDLYTRSPYSEKQAAKMVASLLSAIQYMHDHKIVHRDVSVNEFVALCWLDLVCAVTLLTLPFLSFS